MAEGAGGDSYGSLNFPSDMLNMMTADPSFFSGDFSMGQSLGPYLEILEQPKQRGFRFRYSCEGPSHGGLPGERSEKGRKSYPSVQIVNYIGPARVEVTLVTASDPPKPHAHSLVGKNVTDGALVIEIGPEQGMTASFPNLGIQHVTKKAVKKVLTDRYIKQRHMEKAVFTAMSNGGQNSVEVVNVTPVNGTAASGSQSGPDKILAERIAADEMKKIEKTVEEEAKSMNLSTVRLCFQTYLPDDQGRFVKCLPPVYSNQIYDSKAAAASELKICRMDRQAGFVQGGDEVFLLCDKVQKEDIEVRFFENSHGRDWEDFGKFSTSDVHRQYAIVFKTPAYWNTAIEKPVSVNLELRRKSDKETSNAMEFTYKPTEFDPEHIGAKRRKKVPHFGDYSDQGASTSMSGTGMTGGFSGAGAAGSGVGLGLPYDPVSFSQVLSAMFPMVPPGAGAFGQQPSQEQPPTQVSKLCNLIGCWDKQKFVGETKRDIITSGKEAKVNVTNFHIQKGMTNTVEVLSNRFVAIIVPGRTKTSHNLMNRSFGNLFAGGF